MDRFIGTRLEDVTVRILLQSETNKLHVKCVLYRPRVSWKEQERWLDKWLNGNSGAKPFVWGSGGNYQKVNLLATWAHVYILTLVVDFRLSPWFEYCIFSQYTQPLKMELIQGSETSANYNLTPGKYPEENIQSWHYYLNELEVLGNFRKISHFPTVICRYLH